MGIADVNSSLWAQVRSENGKPKFLCQSQKIKFVNLFMVGTYIVNSCVAAAFGVVFSAVLLPTDIIKN